MDDTRYQTFRSVSDMHLFVLCYDGRKQDLWQGNRRGEVNALKAEYH
jgi:hypothetical protein